jgi:hypothetical protein
MSKRKHESGTFHIATGARVAPPREHGVPWSDGAATSPTSCLDDLELAGPCDVRLLPSLNQSRQARQARQPKGTL